MPPQVAPDGTVSQLPAHMPSGKPTLFASHTPFGPHETGRASVIASACGFADARTVPVSQASPMLGPLDGSHTPTSDSDARTQ